MNRESLTSPAHDGPALRHSPLDAEHRALGARLTEFGGWDMPIQYRSVLEEHRACREQAVVFDVSHLGSVRVAGPGAVPVLQWALTNDLDRIGPGRAQYTHLLDPDDAHVVDDIIVWWVDADELLVMPNASNTDPIVSTLRGRERGPGRWVRASRTSPTTRAVLAVQGPEARALLGRGRRRRWRRCRASRCARVAWGDVDCIVAGTGYTGEDGVEIHVPAEHAAGAVARDPRRRRGARPGSARATRCGSKPGCRCTATSSGPGITPLQAGLGWVVRFDKGDFRGRDAAARRTRAGRGAPAARAAGGGPAPAAGRLRGDQGRRARSAR